MDVTYFNFTHIFKILYNLIMYMKGCGLRLTGVRSQTTWFLTPLRIWMFIHMYSYPRSHICMDKDLEKPKLRL